MARYRGRFKKRFTKFKKKYRKKRSNGLTVTHKRWIQGAVGVTAFFIAMPHIFNNILARIRGGA